jgi:hypothetical protein
MSALTIVREILAADGAVSSVVQGRMHPVLYPLNLHKPGLVLHSVNEADERTLAGHNRYPEAGVIIDAVADDFDTADTLGRKVKDALRDWSGAVAGYDVSPIALTDLDIHDRGEASDSWRRRVGVRVRYRLAPVDDEEQET